MWGGWKKQDFNQIYDPTLVGLPINSLEHTNAILKTIRSKKRESFLS